MVGTGVWCRCWYVWDLGVGVYIGSGYLGVEERASKRVLSKEMDKFCCRWLVLEVDG